MSHKKNILILCDWFLPGYLAGGPIQSIVTLTKNLSNDVDFKIITTDRDLNSNKPYANIKINEWTVFENRQVFYISPEKLNSEFVLQLIKNTPHDTLYLNSLFSKFFAVLPLQWKKQRKLNSSIVLAPRGMLRDGALAVKPLKKKLFLRYAKTLGLYNDVIWQSTSADETHEIKKRIHKKALVIEAPNFPYTPNIIKSIVKNKGELNLCFIARIVDIKNLYFAINILKEIKNCHVTFDVFGPKEDELYWKKCEENAKQLPKNISFNYKGVLKSTEVENTINHYHSLLLPTVTENFGHVIVQTLMQARQVVISNNTPWKNLEKHTAGYDIDLLDSKKFIDAIHHLSNLNQTDYDVISAASLKYIHTQLNIDNIRNQYLNLFDVKI